MSPVAEPLRSDFGVPSLNSDEAVSAADPPVGKAGRVLIASAAEVLVDQTLPVPPPADVTRFSSLPDLVPLASYLPPRVPHVVVVADSSGADLH